MMIWFVILLGTCSATYTMNDMMTINVNESDAELPRRELIGLICHDISCKSDPDKSAIQTKNYSALSKVECDQFVNNQKAGLVTVVRAKNYALYAPGYSDCQQEFQECVNELESVYKKKPNDISAKYKWPKMKYALWGGVLGVCTGFSTWFTYKNWSPAHKMQNAFCLSVISGCAAGTWYSFKNLWSTTQNAKVEVKPYDERYDVVKDSHILLKK